MGGTNPFSFPMETCLDNLNQSSSASKVRGLQLRRTTTCLVLTKDRPIMDLDLTVPKYKWQNTIAMKTKSPSGYTEICQKLLIMVMSHKSVAKLDQLVSYPMNNHKCSQPIAKLANVDGESRS